MRILVVNVGSSSFKLSLLDGNRLLDGATLNPDADPADAVRTMVERAGGAVDAVGHRFVHGGMDFTGPARIDPDVRRRLEALADFAPLHQPVALRALDAVTRILPDAPAIACFDTAFHSSIPPAAATYALPEDWRLRWPLRRFGFHGLSHAYASRRGAEMVGRALGELRIVSCHLGAGASLAAIVEGRSVDTTMGFTPLEGLVMATRSGTVDPGLLLWLADQGRIPIAELADALERRSGLLGLSGSADMKAVLGAEAVGDADASLAVGVYLHRLCGAIASMAAAMAGLDLLIFTGGVGERSAEVRGRAANRLAFLGVAIDPTANSGAGVDADISVAGCAVHTLVIEAREDLEIAREVGRLLGPIGR